MKKILIAILIALGSITYGKEVEIPKNRMVEYPFISFEKIRVRDYKEAPMSEVKITIDTITYERKNMYSERVSKKLLKEPFVYKEKINTVKDKTTEIFQTNKNGIAKIDRKIEFGDLIKDLNYNGGFYSVKFDKKVVKMVVKVEKNGYAPKSFTYEGDYPTVLDVRLKSQTNNISNSKDIKNIDLMENGDNLKIFKNLAKDNNLALKNYSKVEIKNKGYTVFDLSYKNSFEGNKQEFKTYILPLLEYGERLIYPESVGIIFGIEDKNGNIYKYLIRMNDLKEYNNYELSAKELYDRVIRIKNNKRLN